MGDHYWRLFSYEYMTDVEPWQQLLGRGLSLLTAAEALKAIKIVIGVSLTATSVPAP